MLGAEVVLSLNAAAAALEAARSVTAVLQPGQFYADLNVRSVFMKGVTGAAGESLEAARAAGIEEWLRGEIAAVLGEPLLDRLLAGSGKYAVRRIEEMEATAAYLRELGVEPRIAEAAAGWFRQLARLNRV